MLHRLLVGLEMLGAGAVAFILVSASMASSPIPTEPAETPDVPEFNLIEIFDQVRSGRL